MWLRHARSTMCGAGIWLALIVFPCLAAAQAFNLQGGYSTLFQADGGTVEIQSDKYTCWVGAGTVSGHFRFGGYVQTKILGLTLGAGDSATKFSLPMDAFSGGQFIYMRGVGASTKLGDTDIYAFGGTSALGYGTTYFRSAKSDEPMGILFLNHALTDRLHLYSKNVLGSRQTSIEGIDWKPLTWLKTSVAGGIGGNQPYFSSMVQSNTSKVDLTAGFAKSGENFRRVSLPTPTNSEVDGANVLVTVRPISTLSITAGHERFLPPPDSANAGLKANTDQLSAQYSVAGFHFGGGWYHSKVAQQGGTGVSFTAGRRVTSWLDTTANVFSSAGTGTPRNTIVSGTFREKLHPRLSLLQMVSRSPGRTSFSYGGELVFNRFRVSADYQNVYIPFDLAKPFQQALSLNVLLRPFGNLQLNLSTFVDPTGKLRYTISTSSFLYHARQAVQAGPGQARMDKYVVTGRVVDERGEGVAGAAIHVDGRVAYSDGNGRFFLRFGRAKAYPVRVAPDEFTTPGYWEVVSAPESATPELEDTAQEIVIVVRRLTQSEIRSRRATAPVAGNL